MLIVASPTLPIATGTRLSSRPPIAPQPATARIESSSNRRRRAATPSTTENSTPPMNPGIASAGAGASKILVSVSVGNPGMIRLLAAMSMPPSAHVIAQTIPMPTAPRILLSHDVINSPHLARRPARMHFVLQSIGLSAARQGVFHPRGRIDVSCSAQHSGLRDLSRHRRRTVHRRAGRVDLAVAVADDDRAVGSRAGRPRHGPWHVLHGERARRARAVLPGDDLGAGIRADRAGGP